MQFGFLNQRLTTCTAAIVAAGILLLSCDTVGDFGDINEDPLEPTELDARFLFPKVQLETPGNWTDMNRANQRYAGTAVQQFASTSTSFLGTHYRSGAETEFAGQRLWRNMWDEAMVNMQHTIEQLEMAREEGAEVDPQMGQALTWRALLFQLLTDLHGDIPYHEAGKGALNQEFNPAFDSQEEVYAQLFGDLEEAVELMNGTGTGFADQDLLHYQGDLSKWKKFANSLRLRLAMRLVKVDEAWAQQEAEAAVNSDGGVMSDVDDSAYNFHQDFPDRDHENPNSWVMRNFNTSYLSQTLVDWMQERGDPRIQIYGAVVRDGEPIEVEDPDMLKGMPNGYLEGDIVDHESWDVNCRDDGGDLNPDECSVADYAQVHPQLIQPEAPLFHITYPQVSFMLAEANVRGWNVPGSAEQHYENGVRGAMEQLRIYDPDATVSDEEIDTYLSDNPFPLDGAQEEQLRQINEEYWAASFMDGLESWNNWRRSGYPDLEPAPVDDEFAGPGGGHPGNETNGEIPRRFLYGDNEEVLNSESLQEALDRQGPNTLMTRVWWDVEE